MIRFTSLLACLLLLALSCCTTVVEARLGGIRLTEEADSAATNEPKKEKGVGYVPTSIRGQKGSSTNTKDEDPAEVEEVDEEEELRLDNEYYELLLNLQAPKLIEYNLKSEIKEAKN